MVARPTGASGTLIAANIGLALALSALYLVGPTPVLALVALVGWGLVGFGLVSTPLQLLVISIAGPGGDLAASLGASAANAEGSPPAHSSAVRWLPTSAFADLEEDELGAESGRERPRVVSQVAGG